MKNTMTKKERILKALKATNGKEFSITKMAKRLNMTAKNLNSYLWCLEKRDQEITIYKSITTGLASVC